MHTQKHLGFWFFLLLIIMSIIWLSCEYFAWLDAFENVTLNWRYRLRGEMNAPVNLIYVDIDSKALDLMGERPIPRTFFANAIKGLFKYGQAKVIGVDVLFSDNAYSLLVNQKKVEEDTAYLKKVIEENPRLVLAGLITEGSAYEGPEEGLWVQNGVKVGLVNIDQDLNDGGVTELVPAFIMLGDQLYYTMALEMVRLYYDISQAKMNILDKDILLQKPNGEFLKIPLVKQSFIAVNWFTKWLSPKNKRFSLRDAIEAKEWFENGSVKQKIQAENFYDAFKNSIVLIGEADPILNDLALTPFDKEPVPRVSIHGNLIKTLISKEFLETPSIILNLLILLFLTACVAGPMLYFKKQDVFVKLVGFFVFVFYLIIAFWFFDEFNWILPIVAPLGIVLSTTFVVLIIQLIGDERQRCHIKDMFGSYISPELVEDMIERGIDPHLGGEERQITALFSDIENFTAIAESLTPGALMDMMNEYLSEMTIIIQEERGTLDKYIGDGIVSMFGAPVFIEDHAKAACIAACRMLAKQRELCKRWHDDGKNWPVGVLMMRTRFGINTGLLTVGNMGSNIRFNYTMLGDNVNLASRCESIAKIYGVLCIVTKLTWAEIKTQEIVFRFLDRILLNGKTEVVEIFEILGFKCDLDENTFECIEIYSRGMESYFEGHWDDAIACFEQSSLLEPHDDHSVNPSKVLLMRCQELKSNLHADRWDGIFNVNGK